LGAADNPKGWQDAVDRGASGIQTDHPAQLVEYLRGARPQRAASTIVSTPISYPSSAP
jgi:hypothetical protein